MIRTAVLALGLAGVGLFTAAPAMAQPSSTVSCSPCVLLEETMTGVAALPGQFSANVQELPGKFGDSWNDLVNAPQQTIDNIKSLPQQAVDNVRDLVGGDDDE
jgi:hypothetical protein